jgi:hypothetical protein
MNSGSLLKLFAALAVIASLSGCASLSKSECLNANWQDIGIRDGANGQPEEYLIQHSTACAKVGVTPERASWLKGREQGLERFCVPHRAYQIGENGGGFDGAICRNFDQDRLLSAYEQGREVNRIASDLASIDSEIRDIHVALERKDLEGKQRERLAYRLGQLEYQRNDAQRALDDARYRARSL